MQSSQFAILEALHAYRQSQRQFHYSSEIVIMFIARQIWASIAEIIAIGTESWQIYSETFLDNILNKT